MARMAADLLGAPIAAVNLIAERRQWFKAEVGLGVREMPLDNSICARVLLQPGELVIPDLLEDPRFNCNPLVTSGPGLRFYAGELLRSPDGFPLGTLCILDTKPRPEGLSEQQRFVLRTLARQVMSQLDLRRSLAQQERLRAEQARSDALRRQVLDSATDVAVITMDLARKVTGWNIGAANILGWTEADAVGQSADLIFVPEDRAAGLPEAEMERVAREGRAADERWHLRKDGSRFWASGEVMPLRDERGVHTGYLKMLRDRTGQHLAGEALEAMNQRFRLAQQATREAIWDWSFGDNSVLWNEALEEAYGWRPEQVEPTGEWWLARIHPEDRDRIAHSIHAVIDGTGTSWTDEYRFRRADGSYAQVLDRGYVIRGPDGRAVRMIGAMQDLSERKQAEAELREAADRLRLATSAAGIGTFDYRVRSGELTWDDRCRALFGILPGEPVSYEGSFLAGLHPADRVMADAAVRSALDPAGSGRFNCEYRTIGLSDGVERWVLANGEAYFEEGAPVRLIGTVRDVTDRKRAEEALRESEALARENIQRVQLALAAGAIVGTWHWDLPTDRFTVDEAFARTFGLDPALGREGLSLEQVVATVHPDDKAGLAAAIDEVIARGGAYAHQYRVRRADGRYYWIEANGRVDHGPDGRPLSFPGVLIDIEQRRAIEAERDRATTLLRHFIEAVPGVVYAKDREGRMLLANRGTTELIGKPPEFYLGKTDAEFLDDKAQAEAVMSNDRRVMEAGVLQQFEEEVQLPDGSPAVWLSTKAPLRDEKDNVIGLVGTSLDITARKAAEGERQALNDILEKRIAAAMAERERTEEALRQAQKMEAVGQLTGGIAHDFNNLLTGITGSLELLNTRIAQGRVNDVQRYATAALGAAHRAATLTHRLLAFSRRQTLDPKPTDVNRLVAGMEELIRRSIGPAIELEVVGAVGLWPTLVDAPQLESALLNLCINARDAMPDGGRLTIETANRWLDTRTARSRDLQPGQYVSLCVSDTGTGMPPDIIAKAFEPFFTTKPIGQGTGLGLSMIYGFVRQSGGQVRIYSEVGQGTMVCLYLPRHVGGPETAEEVPELADAPRAGKGETVLVVDDEPTVRMLVTEVLEELGYAAIEAADGPSGLRVLQSDIRIDLLVSDVGLPGGMNGRQMADAARITRPDLKVLFITGYAENAVVGNGHLAPGMHVMTKPFAMDALASRIREVIRDS
nr:PAS domain-containing protein [Pararoseomonas baculiformis]